MCVSNNAFEMQSYRLSEEIRKNSIYTPVAVVYSGGKRVNFDNPFVYPVGFIEKLILQDKVGNIYEVEPSDSGLRFAKGEISYNDYQRMQKKDDRKAIALFAGAVSSLFIMGWGILQLFG